METLAGGHGSVGELLGKRRQQFQLRRAEHGAESELADRTRHTGREESFRLSRGQAGQAGAVPVDQLTATVATRLCVHRDACGTERLEVAVDGADRHLELVGQRLGGHPPAGLQEQQQGHQPAGAHGSRVCQTMLTRDVSVG